MSDKNVYESIRDDARSAIGAVLLIAVLVLVLILYIVVAILKAIAVLLFIAAIAVLLGLPIYICLELFYYKRFADSPVAPARYHQRRQLLNDELNAVVKSRTELEERLRLLSRHDEQQVEVQLEPMRVHENRLRDSIRDIATIEANWLSERLYSIELKRRAVWRRIGALSNDTLQNRILALHAEAAMVGSQLKNIMAAYGVTPIQSEKQPAVVYIRRLVEAPARFIREEPYAPRVSMLLSHWFLFGAFIVAVGLATVIVVLGLESSLFR